MEAIQDMPNQKKVIKISIKKEIYDLADIFAKDFNVKKEKYFAIIIENEINSRLDDLN